MKNPFLEFQLLLSRVAPYYSLLPGTVWKYQSLGKKNNNFRMESKLNDIWELVVKIESKRICLETTKVFLVVFHAP